jgi:1,2-diacylglycerol 3-alpha-glucosyltransferase
MKILFISDVYFPRINGVSTSIETFRHELRALGPHRASDRAGLSRLQFR